MNRPLLQRLRRRPIRENPLPEILGVLKSLEQLRPLLARLILTSQICSVFVLRHLVNFVVLFIDSPSSLHLSRLLSVHYFFHLPASSTFLCNTLIKGWARSTRPEEAMLTFSLMLRRGSRPDNFTFPFLSMAAARISKREALQIHSQAMTRGHVADVYVVNTLLNMYSQQGDMDSAQTLFDSNLNILDVVSWNTLIDGYVKVGFLNSARQLFDRMPERNEVSWTSMLSGYAFSGKLDTAQALFDHMPQSLARNAVTWNSMITGFSKQGFLSIARQLFDEMPDKNIISWNAMVSGYALNGDMDSARMLFQEMPFRDVVSWTSMISGYTQRGFYKEAIEMFRQMQKEKRVEPNEVTMASLLSSCAHLAALEQGNWLHKYIAARGMRLDSEHNLGASLIDMYAKCGAIDTAAKVFRSLDGRNVSAWNAMISGLAINGLACESVNIFVEMKNSGVRPNGVTFLGLLMACTHGGMVEEGRFYFAAMLDVYGIEPQIKHYGCMVDLLGRAGMVEEAEETIRCMPMKPDEMILGALLGACRIHKNVEVAERFRDACLELDVEGPGCLVLLSNIYADASLWEEASKIRGMMKVKGMKKLAGYSSVELYGEMHEFVSGDQRHRKISDIFDCLGHIQWELRSEDEFLSDLNDEEWETCL